MRTPLFLLLALGATARAGIAWDTVERSLKPKPGEEQATAEFHFKNTGPGVLKVLRVQSSCGCTVAGVDEDRLEPGKTGTLTAVFDIGERVGVHEKVVVVTTDDAKQPTSALKLRVDIPQMLRAEPRMLIWEKNGAREPKTIRVTVAEGVDVAELTAEASSSDFDVKMSALAPGTREHLLTVTPAGTGQEARAVVTMRAKLRPSGEKLVSAYIAVR